MIDTSTTDGWSLDKLIRVFGRVYESERADLPPDVQAKGDRVRSFMCCFTEAATLTIKSQCADALAAIDAFTAARAMLANKGT